ncbi:MAG: 50S ribosomal protein L13 [Candidatus Gracilibacteria bacterium]|nr:50S ribosomal protein L13 [Candidatus Gracilibacteria bacterium]
MKTSIPTKDQQNARKWFIVDAEGKVLGRLATEIADIIRGKHKPTFTPHMDMGDHVIVINADKIVVTGAKLDQKKYYSHSGHPGALKTTNLQTMLERKPLKVLEHAVSGMMPKNKLRAVFLKKLHLFEGAEHGHEAQQPEVLEI